MTIGIAVRFQDEVLLVADGRRVDLYQPGEPVEADDLNKIMNLPSSGATAAAVISFGVSHVTNLALKIIENLVPRSNYHLGTTPDDICQRIDAAVAGAWVAIAPHFDAQIDLTRDDHVAGFVIGGRVLEVPFIGGTLRGFNRPIAFECSTDPNAKIVLCSNIERGRQILMDKLSGEEILTSDLATATRDQTRQAYMRGAVKTVREMEKADPSIGGTIRYAVISTGLVPYYSGICPEFP
jgi:hypothetical protein